jgi:hypothetical protein
VAVETRLIDPRQRESAPEAGQTVPMERAERQLPTFTMACQIMYVATALLDGLHTPSTNGVGEVYQQLKSIVSTATV